jgi:hypothetical protein
MRGRWDPVNSAIRAALGAITLADMESAATHPAFRLSPLPAALPQMTTPCAADPLPCLVPVA